jgi:hypothetical protein
LRFDDIEAEVSEVEAHERYAKVAVAFIVTQSTNYFTESVAQVAIQLNLIFTIFMIIFCGFVYELFMSYNINYEKWPILVNFYFLCL